MTKACLIIVFNHRFDRNIPVLEKMYGDRFSEIFFLVPFYNGDHPRVIPVYESSHYFQSYFAQGYREFSKSGCTHYIFIGDDCILHPSLNEANLLQQTGLPEGSDYIPGIIEFQRLDRSSVWWHSFKAVDFFGNRKGAEIAGELPTRQEAAERFMHHGVSTGPVSAENIFGGGAPGHINPVKYWFFRQYHLRLKWKRFRKGDRIELPYPVAGSYSDLLVITEHSLRDFCRYCGIMASAGLFVEIAVPTALLLSSRKISQETDLKLRGLALWSPGEITAVEARFNRSLKQLFTGFPTDQLYYHPVKLSRWTNDL